MTSYTLTGTPTTLTMTATGAQVFTNTGASRCVLIWGAARSVELWPGNGADPRSVATFDPEGATVRAYAPGATTTLSVVHAASFVDSTVVDDVSGNIIGYVLVIDGGTP